MRGRLVRDAARRSWNFLIVLETDQRVVVRITAPADVIKLNGIPVFEEIGRPAE